MTPRKSIPFAWKLDALRRHNACVPCAICHQPTSLPNIEYDHHQSLIDDGTHESMNIRPVCSTCHAKKSATEHKNNSKAKRVRKAREVHQAIVSRVMTRPPGKIRGRGFDTKFTKKVNGKTVERRKRNDNHHAG